MLNPIVKIIKFNIFLLAILGIFLQAFSPVYAIEDANTNQQKTKPKKIKRVDLKKQKPSYSPEYDKYVEKLEKKYISQINFDTVLEKAKAHSYDLKIADFDILISKTSIVNARSEYFPKLNIGVGTEYTKSLRNDGISTVSIGDSFINPYTRFQSILGLTLNYNLFDFGVRRGNLNIAKEDVELKKLKEQEKFQELTLTLIDTYGKISMAKKQIEIYQEILKIQEQTYDMTRRLFNAKEVSSTELNDRAVNVADTQKKIEDLKKITAESLNWLSFYTGEDYDLNNLSVNSMKRPQINPDESVDYTKTITWKIYEKEIKKKELALKVAKRNYLPKVNAYGRYYIYGADTNSYSDSFSDIKPSTFTVGGSINMALFDGMKNYSNVQKASLELMQMQVERDKSIAQWLARLATLRSNMIYINNEIECNEKILKELSEKDKSLNRLVIRRIISPIEQNDAKVQLLEQKIDYENNKLNAIAILYGIQTLTMNEGNSNGK